MIRSRERANEFVRTSHISFTIRGARCLLGGFTTLKSPSGIAPTIQEIKSQRKVNSASLETIGAAGD
jgi:hypothetical protein